MSGENIRLLRPSQFCVNCNAPRYFQEAKPGDPEAVTEKQAQHILESQGECTSQRAPVEDGHRVHYVPFT